MKLSDIDAMIEAQFEYERKRSAVYNNGAYDPSVIYQFVNREQLRDISNVTKVRALRIGKEPYGMAQVEYRGCFFLAPSGSDAK